jgi:protein Mpv17
VSNAFGVSPVTNIKRADSSMPKVPVAFKNDATTSRLFRDPAITRGGAVPGWAAYNTALDEKPLFTKAMTSLVGWALGDALAQVFIGSDPFNAKRFITLSLFGFLYHGPSGHYFYNWLDSKVEGTDGLSVFTKVGFDQLVWCPIFMTVFFTYLGIVAGDSFGTIGNKIKNDLFTAVQGSWKVWPFVHAINFKFISTKHRLVYINSVQVAFNMFLSIIGSK